MHSSRQRHPFATADAPQIDQGLRAYMSRVYGLMAGGLAITGLVAWFSLQSGILGALMANQLLFLLVAFAPLGLVFYLSFRIAHMSPARAQTVFWLYAAILGLSLGVIFLQYTGASIARVFLITAVSFTALSLYGYTTKRDLSPMGAFLFIALIGLIIAIVVNLFLQSQALDFAVSVIGVLLFAGLTAYDTQAIRETYYRLGEGGRSTSTFFTPRNAPMDAAHSPTGYGRDRIRVGDAQGVAVAREKAAILGALKLYLDFLNMFIFLLQLLGERR